MTVSTGQNPTDQERTHQRGHLNKIGLQDVDVEILIGILTEFKIQHDVLVALYNQAAEAATARNELPDTTSFFHQLNGLVQSTRDMLKLRLTPDAMTRIDVFVQLEKKHMRMQTGAQ